MGELVAIKAQEIMTAEDVAVLKNSLFKDFTDAEVNYARQVCSHLQLNPLLKQIHFVKRKSSSGPDTITVQVGIDGFRLAAERTGRYAGSDEPIFEMKGTRPAKATVTVYKLLEGQRCPFTASARWEEYYPGDGANGSMWRRMPHNQLAKCAEALALRKAFPAELGSLRTDEEMLQADGATVISKAKSLNERQAVKREPQAVQDAEIVPDTKPTTPPPSPEPKPIPAAASANPECCGKPMMISRFGNKDGERAGKKDWYCMGCKSKQPREPQ